MFPQKSATSTKTSFIVNYCEVITFTQEQDPVISGLGAYLHHAAHEPTIIRK